MRPIIIFAAMAAAAGSGARAAESPAAPTPPQAQALARDVWLIPGGYPAGREPDGNTVVFAAPEGLIVLDTGRHPWHRQAIVDFARSRREPVVAIFNSHWHLDHSSGDAALKAAYPSARLYASRAIEGALKGFLPRSAAEERAYLASGKADPALAEDLKGDIAAIEHGQALVPDVAIESSGAMTVGGLRLDVQLARDAATAGDVWLYDRKTRIAAVGDLVTLPAAFLDTACPAGWRAALGEVWKAPFRIAIPGHGPALTRDQFASYRAAFDALIDCAASSLDKGVCAAGWTAAVRPLLGPEDADGRRAEAMTESYVDLLRTNGGKSPFCSSKAA